MRFLSGLFLSFAVLSACAAEEPTDGRVQLYIKAADPNGGRLYFQWKQTEGPTVKIADPTAAKESIENGKVKWISQTYFIPTEPGIYKFQITVKNEAGEEAPPKIIVREVQAPAPPPTAVAGKDKTLTAGQVVVINGIDSKAAPGRTIMEWDWRIAQAPEKFRLDPRKLKERQFDFKAEEAGVYQFELRVSDGKRWSEPSRMMVTVKPLSAPPVFIDEGDAPTKVELKPEPVIVAPPAAPVVKAVVADGGSLKVGESVVLDGSKSAVEAKLKPEFFWRQETGPLAKTLAPDTSRPFIEGKTDPLNFPVWKFTPSAPGDYSFILEITCLNPDGKGEKTVVKSDPVKYTVGGGNHAPVARIKCDTPEVEVGATVTLDGSVSRDEDGDKLEYLWGKTAGKRGPRNWSGVDGPKIQFTAEEEGEYTVELTVSDGKEKAKTSVTVHVTAGNRPPQIKLQKNYQTSAGVACLIEPTITDPENDRFDVKWVCYDPKDLKIPDPYDKNKDLKFIPKSAGTYHFRVTVTDAKGQKEVAETTVSVVAAADVNRPPTAVIDGPKGVAVGTKVRISGSRSRDPENKALKYTWAQEILEGQPKIAAEPPADNEKAWEFTPTEPGRYVISLTVSDGVQKSDPERFEFTASRDNLPPNAKIAPPENLRVEKDAQITLDGSASADPDGDEIKYLWRKAGGNAEVEIAAADQAKCTVTFKTGGTAVIELIASDATKASEPERVEFQVAKANSKPIANIAGPVSVKPGGLVELSGAGSKDPDGDEITTYIWAQPAEGGGPRIGLEGRELRKRDIRFKADKSGTYELTLKVVDAEGQSSDPVSHKIEVKGLNRPPRAVASVESSGPATAGKEVKLSARGSLDPEGGRLTYKWKQLSGTPITMPEESSDIVNVVLPAPGEYEFELVVNDGENDSVAAKASVTARGANTPPVAVISAITPAEPGEKITLDATESKDADGDKLEYKWTRVSGPEANFPWRGDRRQKVDIELPKEGEYVFELKVFDGKEWSEPVRASVKTRAGNQPPVAVIAEPTVRSEENVETVLDASASSDPDNGPRPLTYTWRQIEGSPRVDLEGEGAQVRFTPKKMGNLKFEVRVSDGKATSEPSTVSVVVMKAGSLPVAIARAIPNPVKAAVKGDKNDPNILELNGTASTAGGGGKGALTYTWKQVGGDDLKLRPADLAKSRVGIRIFVPGKYRFSLTVSDGQNTSQPTYLDVNVVDEGGAAPVSQPQPQPKNPETNTKPAPKHNPDSGEDTAPEGALLPPPRDGTQTQASFEQPDEKKSALQKTLEELARNQEPEAEKQLIAALSNEDKDIRASAASALYQRGINSIPALIQALESTDDNARSGAYWALTELTHETIERDAGKWRTWWAQQPGAKTAPLPKN